MKTINDGKGMTLHLSFEEAAIITEALRSTAIRWDDVEYLKKYAEQARTMIESMTNEQRVIIKKAP